MVSIDVCLCARIRHSFFCPCLFPWNGEMDIEILRNRHEDWRSRNDTDGYFAVYRSNDQNNDLAECHYAGMACFLKTTILRKIFNFRFWKMLKDALR